MEEHANALTAVTSLLEQLVVYGRGWSPWMRLLTQKHVAETMVHWSSPCRPGGWATDRYDLGHRPGLCQVLRLERHVSFPKSGKERSEAVYGVTSLSLAGALWPYPPVMAAFRHTAIGLLRWQGYRNIAVACRRLAAQPERTLGPHRH